MLKFYKKRTCTRYLPSHGSNHGDSFPCTNQVDRQIVEENPGNYTTKTGDTYEGVNPKHSGKTLTFIDVYK